MDARKGEVEIDGRKVRWETTFPKGFRFKCTGKATCCVGRSCEALNRDKKRMGENAKESLEDIENGRKILKHREDGRCVFLEKGKCGIYEERPTICRTFPFEIVFTSRNHAYIDLIWQCCALSCLDDPSKGEEVDFGELVKEKFLSLEKEGILGKWTEGFGRTTKITELMDSKQGKDRIIEHIAGKLKGSKDLLDLTLIMNNFMKARGEIKGLLKHKHIDQFIKMAEKMETFEIDGGMWKNFMLTNFVSYAEYLLKGLEGRPVARKSFRDGRYYKEYVEGNDLVFDYGKEKKRVSPLEIPRKGIEKDAKEFLIRYIRYIWKRAFTQYDLCRLMNFLYSKSGGKSDLYSLSAQMLITIKVLENVQMHLSIISERDGHETITKGDVMEVLDILDSLVLRMCENTRPVFEQLFEQGESEGQQNSFTTEYEYEY